MIIVDITGGFGNQLFQYAAGRALAARHEAALKLRGARYQRVAKLADLPTIARLNVSGEIASPNEVWQLRELRSDRLPCPLERAAAPRIGARLYADYKYGACPKGSPNYDPSWPWLPDNTYLRGSWRSEKYFKEAEPAIRREFTPRDSAVAAGAKAFVEGVRLSGVPGKPVVGVHVPPRNPYGSDGRLPISSEYLHGVMARFDPESSFIIFSPSPEALDPYRGSLRTRRVTLSIGCEDLHDFARCRRATIR